jgi:hypothetical protein
MREKERGSLRAHPHTDCRVFQANIARGEPFGLSIQQGPPVCCSNLPIYCTILGSFVCGAWQGTCVYLEGDAPVPVSDEMKLRKMGPTETVRREKSTILVWAYVPFMYCCNATYKLAPFQPKVHINYTFKDIIFGQIYGASSDEVNQH